MLFFFWPCRPALPSPRWPSTTALSARLDQRMIWHRRSMLLCAFNKIAPFGKEDTAAACGAPHPLIGDGSHCGTLCLGVRVTRLARRFFSGRSRSPATVHDGLHPEEQGCKALSCVIHHAQDTAKELQDHAAKTQDTLVDAVENAEVAEIKRAVFRSHS
ncbi:unnamed protein product [Prorocentrum cordatum]|uniref:Uncharacterized protein n=1 Tax=Prorocentrum cordatum TaxID=2364126 RepID=A0ABN9S9Z3_9DINO|nr:unnamed protein product [Polarella glacialis]